MITDVLTMTGRSVRLARLNVDTLLMSIVLPLLMLLLFVTVRGLLTGTPVDRGWVAPAWTAGLLVASVVLASALFRRRARD